MSNHNPTLAELRARVNRSQAAANDILDALENGPKSDQVYIVVEYHNGIKHGARGNPKGPTLCGIEPHNPPFIPEARPITCQDCLEALGCLGKEA